MPQMAPLSWLSLFIYFVILLIITNPLNYFLCLKTQKSQKSMSSSHKISWKW